MKFRKKEILKLDDSGTIAATIHSAIDVASSEKFKTGATGGYGLTGYWVNGLKLALLLSQFNMFQVLYM